MLRIRRGLGDDRQRPRAFNLADPVGSRPCTVSPSGDLAEPSSATRPLTPTSKFSLALQPCYAQKKSIEKFHQHHSPLYLFCSRLGLGSWQGYRLLVPALRSSVRTMFHDAPPRHLRVGNEISEAAGSRSQAPSSQEARSATSTCKGSR